MARPENRVYVGVLSLAMVSELAGSGKLKILALAGSRRAPSAPDIPTAAELGFPELVLVGGHGLFARTSTPPELRDRVVQEVREALNEPTAAQRIANLGFVLQATAPDEFAAFLDRETERVADLVRHLGPKARARNTQ